MKPLAALALIAAAAAAAPVPKGVPDDPATDPATFLPTRTYHPRPGKAVGVLVADAVKVMGRDGRSSQADAIAFSAGGGSYNWLYVPVEAGEQITNLTLKVGEKGAEAVTFPRLSMASPKTTAGWGLKGAFALAEVTVNDGKGAPAGEAFVASAATLLDGSRAYPLVAADVVAAARGEYAAHVKGVAKELDEAMGKSRRAAVGDEKPSGKAADDELVHVAWLPDSEQLAVTFLTKRTDGVWQKGGGGANPDDLRDPPALPVLPPPGEKKDDPAPAAAKRRPPPPAPAEVTWGTGFGVEFGRTYQYGKTGRLERTVTLSPVAFKQVIPPPPAVGGGGREPFALPPAPPKPGEPPPPAAPKK